MTRAGIPVGYVYRIKVTYLGDADEIGKEKALRYAERQYSHYDRAVSIVNHLKEYGIKSVVEEAELVWKPSTGGNVENHSRESKIKLPNNSNPTPPTLQSVLADIMRLFYVEKPETVLLIGENIVSINGTVKIKSGHMKFLRENRKIYESKRD